MPVSTYGQTLGAQLEQLRGAGCQKIHREGDGPQSDPRELLKMLAALAPGDDWQAMFRNSAQSRRGRTELFNAILERVA